MGGDSSFPWISSAEDESSLGLDYQHKWIKSPLSSGMDEGSSSKLENGYDVNCEFQRDCCGGDDESLSTKLKNGPVINGECRLSFGEVPRLGPGTLISSADERHKSKTYIQVLKSYENVKCRTQRLEAAQRKVLSYTPGSWVEKAGGGMYLDEYDVPKSTSLLLIGPKASGKSSLVNKISQVLEDDVFTSAPAQVSNNQSSEDGTYFVNQYTIPRRSGSFCLYDTRGLSDDTSENLKVVKRWMKKGVCNGELIKRKSDSIDLKARLKCKKHGVRSSSQWRVINFVIFVVNGVSVLEAMNGDTGKKRAYCQSMATIFNNPLLSFKDDKPVLVVTHGDLLSLSDRVRIRVYLGDLIGIPPSQIFDIPESDDSATVLTIIDMLIYCLERADRNLSVKKQHSDKKLPVGKQHPDKKLPIVKQNADMKFPVQKQHPDKKLRVKKQCAYKKLPVKPRFADKIDMQQPSIVHFWKCLLISFLLCAFVSFHNYKPRPTNNTPRNYSFHAGHHPHAPTNQSHENGTQPSFSHTPTNTSQRNGAQNHGPINKSRKNVDEARAPTNDASRKKDAKARLSHARTHKSKARGVKDGRRSHVATDKEEEIKAEWHRIRHVW